MRSNFAFLERNYPILYQIGSVAEKYLYSDPNSCLIKLGMFGETIVNLMLQLDSIEPPITENTHANRIRKLKQEGLLPQEIDNILYSLRMSRNNAIHANFDDIEKCKILLERAFSLAVWFLRTYCDNSFKPENFSTPDKDNVNYELIASQQEELIKQLEQRLREISAQSIGKQLRRECGQRAASLINLSEKETRLLIDKQLRKVGWEVDSEKIRYSKGCRPVKGKNLAIAEWLTDSRVGDRGFADYALFVGLKLVGLIEAKRAFLDVPSVIDNQCKDYAKNIRNEDEEFIISTYGNYKVPFIFATNGKPYQKQFEIKSGIWFLDLRNSSNCSKALQGWMSPDNIMEKLAQDVLSANNTLKSTAYDLLTDTGGLGLRPYQIKAIESAEKAIVDGQQTVLLAMATGTGKTRTVLGMIYRFLESNRFKRILFLVDRSALGEQAQDVFKDVTIKDLMTLDNIYDIKNLDDMQFDKETRVHVATVQGMIRRIFYNDEGVTMPAVADYDLIIVDEAHRGYVLDKEMSDDEYLYRDQSDYMSKYRRVIEYFDAVKVALTATPALHTTEIFGRPVFTYSYREAVIDGFLVDHDAPHHIQTQLNTDGIKYEKGDTLAVYNPVTGEITNSDELEDELIFDIDTFNRQVITESFNRTVLQELAKGINPEGDGKTLIYAVNNQHADLIVQILREIYEPNGISNDAIKKITGSICGGDPKKVLAEIKLFKNEQFPNVAVTVDLLTTGIDVPEITTLVFMRRVKSRILFEQMLGRATRLCPKINKDHFEIYDPVRVYESLEDVSTMKPVVVDPSATFIDLINGLDVLDSQEKIKNQIDLVIAKLQRKQRKLTEQQSEHFKDLAEGMTPTQFISKVASLPIQDVKNLLQTKKELFALLDEGGYSCTRSIVIADKEDCLLSHLRGYGDGKKPEDYLCEFKEFIIENAEKIETLKLICTRPADLTRNALKSLILELNRNGFSEQWLRSAWKDSKNEDIAADIISFIRSLMLGSELMSPEMRIKNAIKEIKKKHNFTKLEQDWLARIESFMISDTIHILNEETFNSGIFRDSGGFDRINKQFNNNLKEIIKELNIYLYNDGGKAA